MLEFRRQAFHILLGVVLVILLNFNIIGIKILSLILIIGIIISFLSKKHKIPVVEWFLENFERENVRIRGQGVLTCFLGVIIALLLFEKNIALASILVLSLGDSFCHLGKFGRLKHPFNDLKFIEGLLIGVAVATFGAVFFVSFWQAFLGAAVALVVESFDLKIGNYEIDDNILIPLVAGVIMSLL
ncbi:MAG: hypothetical protein CMH62_02780 [Nanoarchaeota archaeon]|nr:hypothetical protein [Nanoarchaeota archaeon]